MNKYHYNPLSLHNQSTGSAPSSSPESSDSGMREKLLKRQKELLELQKRKVELELLQTKAILEEQQKKLENHLIPDNHVSFLENFLQYCLNQKYQI